MSNGLTCVILVPDTCGLSNVQWVGKQLNIRIKSKAPISWTDPGTNRTEPAYILIQQHMSIRSK